MVTLASKKTILAIFDPNMDAFEVQIIRPLYSLPSHSAFANMFFSKMIFQKLSSKRRQD